MYSASVFSPCRSRYHVCLLTMAFNEIKEDVNYRLTCQNHSGICFKIHIPENYLTSLILQILNSSSLHSDHNFSLSSSLLYFYCNCLKTHYSEISRPLIFPFSPNLFILLLASLLPDYLHYLLTRILNPSSYYSTIYIFSDSIIKPWPSIIYF